MTKNFFEVNNVDFNVGNKTKVKNVSFAIENQGDVICLLGPSGIGKTTILRTIAGLEKINNGSIELNDKILSLSLIEPDLIFSKPAIVLRIVVFPTPDGPNRQIISPLFSILNETFLTLVFPPALKLTLLISKKFLLIYIS